MSARAVIATPPVPETLGVLRAGGVRLPPPVADRLAGIDYHRTLAVTALLDAPPAVPPPGGVQLQEGPFGFVADNVAKGVSAAPALTLHASHAVSAARWDDDPASVVADLLAEARTWIGDATVLQAELDHWRYAGPIATDPDPEVSAIIDGLPIVFAGDAFAGPKFEGAFNSGRAAAEAVARLL